MRNFEHHFKMTERLNLDVGVSPALYFWPVKVDEVALGINAFEQAVAR